VAAFVSPEEWQPTDGIRLEDAAKRVVFSDSDMSVIAGPGAGKTELLAQRALYLLQTGQCKPPQKILAISFKRDAAKALKDRVSRRCSPEQARRFDSFTFDAFAKSLLDRFLALTPDWCRPARDYRISFPSRDDWEEFFQSIEPPVELGGVKAARAVTHDQIERLGPLALTPDEPRDMHHWIGVEWWKRCLRSSPPAITFAMIGRLAEAILTHNSDVLAALRLTYSHVFLDEFQDTTGAQYSLVALGFAGSDSVLTAVGDTKQRIMTWAGAEAEVFSWFEKRFDAERMRLQMNHRSNERIVQIVNDLVKEIEPDAVETICARADGAAPEDASAFWFFNSDEDEANFLAEFIARDIEENEERSPDDFVLLVRARADQAEARLEEPFSAKGLRLRNEARLVGGIAIQDLLTDEIVSLVLGFMRLAVGVRGREIYRPVQEAISAILGTDFENTRDIKRLDGMVQKIIAALRHEALELPASADMSAIVSAVVGALGEAPLRRTFRQYEDGKYFLAVQKALAALMSEYSKAAADWKKLLDAVEGKGQIRLMTIHKSKGLEYHTVIFVGLHHNAFWGYKNNEAEETNAFFVALSRARERVYFTKSAESGDTARIQGLVDLLTKAGVPFVKVT